MQTWCDLQNQVSPTLAYMQAKQDFCLFSDSDPTENNMLNVRIVKGGCRGREAVRFGVVSLNFLLPQKGNGFKYFIHGQEIHLLMSNCMPKLLFLEERFQSFKTDSRVHVFIAKALFDFW